MPRVKRIAGVVGVPRRWLRAEGTIDVAALELTNVELPGVVGGGMPGRNGQRKTGTARGWPRRSRTAEASHISRSAMKLGCARERGGWGRLSDDGRDSKPDRSEDPWGRWSTPPHGGAVIASTDPTLGGSTLKHEGRRQTDRMSVYAGSRLKLMNVSGRSRLIRQPSSRNGENPPCGMIGGTMETAASFEARNAPSSYPTATRHRPTRPVRASILSGASVLVPSTPSFARAPRSSAKPDLAICARAGLRFS